MSFSTELSELLAKYGLLDTPYQHWSDVVCLGDERTVSVTVIHPDSGTEGGSAWLWETRKALTSELVAGTEEE